MVMGIFCDAGRDHVPVGQQNGFGLPCRARRKIETTGVIISDLNLGRMDRGFFKQFLKGLCILWNFSPYRYEVFYGRKIIPYSIDSIDKFLAKNKAFRFCNTTAVLDLSACETKVQGNRPRARTDDSKIGNQPIDGVSS